MNQPPYSSGGPPPGYASGDEKTLALLAHFGGAVFGFLAPLLVFLIKGSQSPTVRAHAVAALNFQIVCSATIFGLAVIQVCGFFLPDLIGVLLRLASLAAWAGQIIFAILGGLRANDGQIYRYPIQVNLVK